jgi:hypothetical protein
VVELRPHADVAWRRVDDDVVLVQLRTNRIYSLSTTAARAWELLSEGLDRPEVERSLLEEYDVAPDELGRSLDELLRELSEAQLIAPA